MKSYSDKVVVITGSAVGIGFSLAKQFGSEGAKVVVSGLPTDDIESAVERLNDLNITAAAVACDVSNRHDVENLADFAVKEFGTVDVLVNNAGVSQKPRPIIEMDLAEFRKVHEINIYGVLHGIQVFGKRFIEQGTPAAIYNLGSENSIYPCVPSAHAYVSSKHAILAITELLAEEVPSFIDVALIMPGLVKSEMTRGLGLGMETDDFSKIILDQLKAGELYAVSHSYNKVRLVERFERLSAAFDKYAPREANDEDLDIRTIVSRLQRN
ncbi:SDR family NAD(P)-dependent oxidoreductase [Congregibacter sp.]|uniref:SDR family NAD(P)-dependent oxidoreductase n=1 Tax=Congregibacter sp. TaxID=2744308 RepID=UPI003859AEEF